MKNAALVLSVTMMLAACATEGTTTVRPGSSVPENVLALAAPGQDLSTAVLQEDNCFWYRHVGPVETTMLPLRARDGRPICALVEDAA